MTANLEDALWEISKLCSIAEHRNFVLHQKIYMLEQKHKAAENTICELKRALNIYHERMGLQQETLLEALKIK